jgi:HEAT repeat protein
MIRRLRHAAYGLLTLAAICAPATAGPTTAEDVARQKAALDRLVASVAAAGDEAGKLAAFEAVAGEPSVEVRRRVLDLASTALSRDREAFFKSVLEKDRDAGIRAQAAAALGRVGSAASIPALALAAKADPVTDREIGCILARGSARRDAAFALADLAERFPKSVADIAAELRKLAPQDPQDRDAVVAALFRVTQDPAVIAPVLEQLSSPERDHRRDAVVQLRFFGLKKAPRELVGRMDDADPEVQSWAALTLGEIDDASAAPALLAAAGDVKRGTGIRCNAIVSLSRLKAADAAPALERLRDDPDPTVRAQAAAAVVKLKATTQPAPRKD